MKGSNEENAESRSWRDRPVRLATVAMGVVITTLIGLFVGAVVQRYGLFEFLGSQPSIAEQLDDVRHVQALDNRRVVVSRRIDLRGNGAPSYLLVFRDTTVSHGGFYPKRSDLVRIYDTSGGDKLRLAYEFEPLVERPPRSEVYVFVQRFLGDLDEDGTNEVVGAWELFAMAPIEPRPVVIHWDDARSRYVAIPLLPSTKTFYSYRRVNQTFRNLLLPAHGVYARDVRHVYLEPVRLVDKASAASLRLYGAEEFLLAKGRFGGRLIVGAYVIRQRAHADLGTFQLLPWSFSLIGADAQISYCGPEPRSAFYRGDEPIVFQPRGPLLPALASPWRQAQNTQSVHC